MWFAFLGVCMCYGVEIAWTPLVDFSGWIIDISNPTTPTQNPQWRNNAAALLEEPRLQAIFDTEFAAGHEAMAYPWYYTQVRAFVRFVRLIVWIGRGRVKGGGKGKEGSSG